MAQALRLLIVEDFEDDALLLVRELRQGGIDPDFTRVESPEELQAALADGPWDAIFSDYHLPAFTGLDALRIVREMGLDLPFILVSGVIGEETAVEALKAGAHDYLLKGRYTRLVPALERARRDVALQRERQQTAAELSRHQEHLEELVQTRTKELAAANRELDSFNLTISHDLRSPVINITNFCRIIFEKHDHSLSETCRKYIRFINEESLRMDKLINTMLGFCRLSRQKMQLREVDLSALAQTISRELQTTDQNRKAEFLIAEHLSCHGDQDLLKVALGNLLGNAWKYSAKKALSTIEFGAINRDEPTPTFYVRDNGAGFDSRYAGKLFKMFQRLHTAAEFKGHGVGLITVERVIQRHGGKVWAESEEGEGATFYFTLHGTEPGSQVRGCDHHRQSRWLDGCWPLKGA